jgi:GLPGLI family protein
MKKLLFILSILFIGTIARAQISEGVINYDMKMEGMPPEATTMMGNMTTKISFKKGKALTEVKTNINNIKTLVDATGMLMLMDNMGQKMYSKISAEKMKQQMSGYTPAITYTNEKRTIAGYSCVKAIITIKRGKDQSSKMDVWYTNKIAPIITSSNTAFLTGLKGMPMEYEMNQGPMKMKLTAKNVSTSPVADATFNLSTAGYTEMSNMQKHH